jgi:hypothetical protein
MLVKIALETEGWPEQVDDMPHTHFINCVWLVYTWEVVLSIAVGCYILTAHGVCHFYAVTTSVFCGEMLVTELHTVKT